jgi:hypothetical protein
VRSSRASAVLLFLILVSVAGPALRAQQPAPQAPPYVDELPGVYIPQEALGVRIEDDVLVTATGTGHELLTASAPRTVAEVEWAMQRTPAEARRPGRED